MDEREAQVRSLISAGRKLEAIKQYREFYHVGLKEAKDAVDAMEAGRPAPIPSGVSPYGPVTDPGFAAEVRRLAREENLIRAIQLYRERTGLGLKEAKDAVERIAAGETVSATPAEAPGDLQDEIDAFLRQNQKIRAVKLLRERTGLDLKTAKEQVDRRAEELGVPSRMGCFIATAAYGSPMVREVRALRQYRDRVLLRSAAGRRLVAVYYRMSPSLARLVERHPLLGALVRRALAPLAARVARTPKVALRR